MFNKLKEFVLKKGIEKYLKNHFTPYNADKICWSDTDKINPMAGPEFFQEIDVFLEKMNGDAVSFLKKKMEEQDLKNSDVYNQAYIKRQYFHNILNGHKTSLKNVLKIGFVLRLNRKEMLYCVHITGSQFSRDKKFDVAMQYIINTIDDPLFHIKIIDNVLSQLGIEPLFYSKQIGIDLIEYEIDLLKERYKLESELEEKIRDNITNINDINRMFNALSDENIDNIDNQDKLLSKLKGMDFNNDDVHYFYEFFFQSQECRNKTKEMIENNKFWEKAMNSDSIPIDESLSEITNRIS